MSWRIHFTAEDLARTRVGASLGPLAETMFSLTQLQCHRRRAVVLNGWRERALHRVTPDMRPLLSLVHSWGLDLWTLTGEAPTIEQGVAALLAMPRDRVLTELAAFEDERGIPRAAWIVADSDGAARKELARAAIASYRGLIEPHWAHVNTHLHAERVTRGRVLLDGGIERLLATLYPDQIRWRAPILEIQATDSYDVYLNGRGITLVPSLFVGYFPVLLQDLTDESAPPRLVFPAAHELSGRSPLFASAPSSKRALAALVGRTRAAVLRTVGDGCTTTELARNLEISPAAASQHASVLREAGLIVTRRQGRSVLHSVTPLGLELLEAG